MSADGQTESGADARWPNGEPRVEAPKPSSKTTEFRLVAGTIIGTLVVASPMLWFGKISSDQWVSLATWAPSALGGAYAVSRGLAKGLAALGQRAP